LTGSPSIEPGTGGDFAALAPGLTRRLETILETVQQQTDRMLDEARGEPERPDAPVRSAGRPRPAGHPIAERQRRIAALSDELIAKTEAVLGPLEEIELVRRSFGRLLRGLSETADGVTEQVAGADRDRLWLNARQAAIQLAGAGSTRAQVEAHLRDYMRLDDPAPLLEQLFGPGSGAGARVAWALPPTGSPPPTAEPAPPVEAARSRVRRGRLRGN